MVLVLAVGNPLRADDRFALEAARGLEGIPGLEVMAVHGILPEHAERAAAADGVVFLDAREGGGEPGRVAVEAVDAEGTEAGCGHPHSMGPRALLALARSAFGAAPPAVLVTVTGADFGFGERLSPAAARAVPAARAAVLAAAVRWLPGGSVGSAGEGDRRA